ncbi:23S rRNA pseudouridylate synthase [Corynebacterium poyangense]|uniref:RNA pseudouridylate synthase n=1 Tax=Corynebacterium poyangense TaxID=2684405 RepID=A0A7H0SRU3_9CORY|nr:pseudouridine synthase [Corynebacterium poyangense]QNQ91268.1 23S rRNA pseudouridylate synthase [Corynebacterium poyangense]
MGKTISHLRALRNPLPVKDGLNASRIRFPEHTAPLSAYEWLLRVVARQRYRHPSDTDAEVAARFNRGEVVDCYAQPISPDQLMHPGENMWFYRIPAEETPVPFPIRTLAQTQSLLVIDKPPFLATMPRGRHIVETALTKLRRETGNDDLIPAHRLDRLTSGVLAFIVRRQDRGIYQNLFAASKTDKCYEAIADYRPDLFPQESLPLQWTSRLAKTPGTVDARVIDGPANTHTTVIRITPLNSTEQSSIEAIYGPQPPQARYELRPLTGKTHQLRVHMCAAGVPILGDPIYPTVLDHLGADFTKPLQLVAKSLSFVDPLSEEHMCFSSSYPTPLTL